MFTPRSLIIFGVVISILRSGREGLCHKQLIYGVGGAQNPRISRDRAERSWILIIVLSLDDSIQVSYSSHPIHPWSIPNHATLNLLDYITGRLPLTCSHHAYRDATLFFTPSLILRGLIGTLGDGTSGGRQCHTTASWSQKSPLERQAIVSQPLL